MDFFNADYYSDSKQILDNLEKASCVPYLKEVYPSSHTFQDYYVQKNNKLHVTSVKSRYYSNQAKKVFVFFCDNHQSEELWKKIFIAKNNPVPVDAEVLIVNGNQIQIYASSIQNDLSKAKTDSLEEFVARAERFPRGPVEEEIMQQGEDAQSIIDAQVRIQVTGKEADAVYFPPDEYFDHQKYSNANQPNQSGNKEELTTYFWRNKKVYNARLNLVFDYAFNNYEQVILAGMGEGAAVLNAKVDYILKVEKELLEEEGKEGKDKSIEGKAFEYKRPYDFVNKMKGCVFIDAVPTESLSSFLLDNNLKTLLINKNNEQTHQWLESAPLLESNFTKVFLLDYDRLFVSHEYIAPIKDFMDAYFKESQTYYKRNQNKFNRYYEYYNKTNSNENIVSQQTNNYEIDNENNKLNADLQTNKKDQEYTAYQKYQKFEEMVANKQRIHNNTINTSALINSL